jgi:class 3 adenylate cyclase/tetratricopeptide (TPR) repeat protein
MTLEELAGDPSAFIPNLLLDRPVNAPRHWRAEGTMVLIDISGFTALSDQLAARGRAGTEDLIDTLSRIFTLLLSATDDAGDVVKFAGDALMIHYAGEDHARRGAHAASTMQRLLRVVGSVRLTGASARLRMSIGVHSGRFDMLLTGRDHLDLVVAGDDVTTVLALQDRAAAGEILVSGATAALLAPGQTVEHPSGHRLLRRAAALVSAGSAARAHRAPLSATLRHLPAVFADRPDLLAADSDHRWAAVGFVQVKGLNRLLGASGGLDDHGERATDAALEHVDALTSVVTAAATEHDVTLLDTDIAADGYRYFLTAGAPLTVEDAEGRLTRALLAIVSADSELSVQAGVTAGRVFAGTVGAPFRRTYSVMGDTTNLAARLTAKAEAGSVLAQRGVVDRSLTDFEVDPTQWIRVKGKPDPIEVCTARGVRGLRGRHQARVPLVGRTEELLVLRKALSAAEEGGSGSVVEVIGEAGIGKSRLVAEALAGSALPVVTLAADPYGAEVAYHGLTRLLRPLLDLGDSASAESAGRALEAAIERSAPALRPWAPLLAPAIGARLAPTPEVSALDESFRGERFAEALSDLLHALLPERAALVVDDAQWIDPTSAAALGTVLGSLESTSWAVLLMRRDVTTGLHAEEIPTAIQLRPEPLDAELAGRLVAAGAGRPVLPGQMSALVGRGGGNPYFLLELAASADAETHLPESVEELVGERIDALHTVDREILRQAAVLGGRFSPELYAEAVGHRDLPAAAGTPGLARFLEVDETGMVTFRRDVYREVAYDRLTFRRRRELHRLSAAAIERAPGLAGSARLPMLAFHYTAAADWPQAYNAALAAAEAARTDHAVDESIRFLRSALEAGRRTRRRTSDLAPVWEALGDACQTAGRYAEALTAYASARRATLDPAASAGLIEKSGAVLNLLGRPDAAVRALRQARVRARAAGAARQPELLARIDVAESGTRIRQGRWIEARDLAGHAVGLLEGVAANGGTASPTPAVTAASVLAKAYLYRDIAAGELAGDTEVTHLDEALGIYTGLGDYLGQSKVLCELGVRAYFRGDWTAAAESYERAREASSRAGDVVDAALEAANQGEILCDQGDVEAAMVLFEQALAVFAASDNPYLVAYVTDFIGRAHLRSGDTRAADQMFARAAAGFAALGARELDWDARIRRAEVRNAEGRYAEAAALADEIFTEAGEEPLPAALAAAANRAVGRARAGLGDLEGAVRHGLESLRLAGSSPFDRALSLACLVTWSPDDRERRGAEAVELLRGLGVHDVDSFFPEVAAVSSAGGGSHYS